ncbi:hypothetical protein AGABI1DRAFT_116185 [Agaricus bisporus var. burnettii JB137-S8]|uniref:Uncharacterized protein n=1 Tax=Agaricus bisporus var. burnettii (strain JB137-S8 / ATCC MYA-4627 / FGSC 10392) TaxID=597362 RepID=K5XMB6_AGABU|nr:uncharacterized protein AGABI1DRAFT_116185 [Agaricus bisporus var. burnettii JB137-S8]EKM75705.1 hypothetical protein AGABI1DRAFT_116185 [Agaricus bisporus var. burnettii JB137-S8]
MNDQLYHSTVVRLMISEEPSSPLYHYSHSYHSKKRDYQEWSVPDFETENASNPYVYANVTTKQVIQNIGWFSVSTLHQETLNVDDKVSDEWA